jgi:citrate synthase
MGFPTDMYPVLFVLPLLAGWLAHWQESIKDQTDTYTPNQFYNGKGTRDFI